MRRLMLLAFLALLASVALPRMCNDEEVSEEGSVVAPDDPELGFEIRNVAPRASRASRPPEAAPGAKDTRYGLRVLIASEQTKVEIGARLQLDVTVSNASGKPISLFNVQRGFHEACAISVTPPEGRPLRFSEKRKGGGPSRAEDFVTLAPGERTKGTVDIAPLLARMDARAPGPHRIALLFDSPFKGEPYGVRTWNELGYKEVASNAIEVELVWPEWRSSRGVTVEIHDQVSRLLDAIGPDGTMEPEYRDLLVEMGPEAIIVLEEKLAGCAESSFDRSLQGWNALYALISVRQAALPHLATSPRAGRPANLLLMDLMAEVEARGQSHPIKPFLSELARGRGETALHAARMTRHATRGGPRTITVHADGRVEVLEPAGKGRLRSRTAVLGQEAVRPVFAAMFTGLFWIQRPLRTSGSGKECLLQLEFLRGRKALHRVDVWETEAVTGNRHLGRVHAAFRAIDKLAKESLDGKAAPGGGKDPVKK